MNPLESLLLASSHSSGGAIRFPETASRTVNPAPQLPSTNAKYFYTTPDATIDSHSGDSSNPYGHLLDTESTEEFEYGDANRLATQAAYLNVPHAVQRVLTPLVLPSAKEARYGNGPFELPFPHIRKGDLAFHLRLEHRPQPEQFVNLQTANYILHGIQHYGDSEPAWRDTFWKGFGLDRLDPAITSDCDAERLCTHVVRWCMAPFGVVVSETVHKSRRCSALKEQAIAMVVDGRIEKGGLRNFWASEISDPSVASGVDVPQAGDELVLMLDRVPMRVDDPKVLFDELERWTYVLPNRNSSACMRATFPIKRGCRGRGFVGPLPREHYIWQLVPSVFSIGSRECWERRGFWRLGVVY